ncbi:MAG: hypothetical protein B6I31_00075 [Desulfobacteraceae bacterium 4572_19]|nr:MAG: hypothetical protein B6I31_00075 [Desulfobacteraceae bacterium 4572_19]
MKLENILKKKNEGKWFEIPGEYFESDPVKLLLKPINTDDLTSVSVTETRYNKKTHQPYEYTDKKKQTKNFEDLLFNSVIGWTGIDEEFNRINWDTFIKNLGNIKVLSEYSEEEEKEIDITLSSWISNTCLNPENFYKDDTENL